MATNAGQELAMAGLKLLSGYIRQGLGKKMRLRFTPEVRFIQDEGIERGSRVSSPATPLLSHCLPLLPALTA